MRIAVTGGAGLIGSHLCERLLAEGSSVICLDNFVTGRKQNLGHLMNDRNFSLLEHDVTKSFELLEKVDQVYNLASPASPKDFSRIPAEIMMANSVGVKNALDFAVKNNARLLQASTSEVYGNPLQHPQKESYWGNVNPVGGRSCYDESKRFAEALIATYQRKKGLEARVARIFNTFGPRMRKDDGRVVPAFITQALAGKPITIYGDGNQTRSFCFVTDLVGGLIKLMNSSYCLPVNLGNPNETTIKQLAEVILELTGSKSRLLSQELREDEPMRRKPDLSLAEKELHWKPTVSLEQGLLETIQWFKKRPFLPALEST